MLLSIGMMVKNEEKYLEECLTALQPLLDNIESELIIIDTGSVDRTVEIAKKFTDNVYFHKWDNNFSEMRNRTISYCSGEWFLCIDGDEVLENTEYIIEFFKTKNHKKYNSAALTVKNYVNSKDYSIYNTLVGLRLFKRDKDFKFVGAVHNQPQFKKPVKKIPAMINHYGYISDDKELMEKKFERTSKILISEIEKNPTDIYLNFQLSISYAMHGDSEEALIKSQEAYELALKNDMRKYLYVITNYAQQLVVNNRIDKCKDICLKGLELIESKHPYKIDLYYYLGKSEIINEEYEESLDSYQKYIQLISDFNKGKLPIDISLTNNCIAFEQDVYRDMAVSNFKLGRYKEVCKNKKNICNKDIINELILLFTESYIKSGYLQELREYYESNIIDLNSDVINKFCLKVKSLQSTLSEEEKSEINSWLPNIRYSGGNTYDFKLEDSDEARVLIDKFIKTHRMNNIEKNLEQFSNMFYAAFRCKYDIRSISSKVSYNTLINSIDYCINNFKDFFDLMVNFLCDNDSNVNDFQSERLNIVLCRVILLKDRIDEEKNKFIFHLYIKLGINFINTIYSNYIIESELIDEVKNEEHRFFLYMLKADRERKNKVEYIRYINRALTAYPYMKKGIEILMNEISNNEKENNNKINELKDKLVENINILVLLNQIDEAINIINEYNKITEKNKRIYI